MTDAATKTAEKAKPPAKAKAKAKPPAKAKAKPKAKPLDHARLADLAEAIDAASIGQFGDLVHRLEAEEGLKLRRTSEGRIYARMARIEAGARGDERAALLNWANKARRAKLKKGA